MGDNKKKFVIITSIVFLISLVSFLALTLEPSDSIQNYPEINSSSCETDDCLILLAIEESNPNYCKDVSEENINFCYPAVALKIRDYDLCDWAEPSSIQTCKIAISHDSKDMKACKKYSFEDGVENLMQGKPTKEMCDSVMFGTLIEVGDEKGSLTGMFMETDPSNCKAYRDNPNIQDSQLDLLIETCYYEVAISNQDISYCEKTSPPLTYFCLGRASAEK